jgi:hypothetical protein
MTRLTKLLSVAEIKADNHHECAGDCELYKMYGCSASIEGNKPACLSCLIITFANDIDLVLAKMGALLLDDLIEELIIKHGPLHKERNAVSKKKEE